jgi:hypothetical protein
LQCGQQYLAQRAVEGRLGIVPQNILAALAGANEAALEAIGIHITTDSMEGRGRLKPHLNAVGDKTREGGFSAQGQGIDWQAIYNIDCL